MSQTLTTEVHLGPMRSVVLEEERDIAPVNSQDQSLNVGVIPDPLSKIRTVALIGILTGVTIVSSFSTGLLTVGLPRMAPDLDMPSNLLLW